MPTTSDAAVRSAGEEVLVLRDVSVRFRVPKERVYTFKEFAIHWLRGRVVYEQLDALSHLNLTVRRGEQVGIIGRNGAGKSTLLKVIARVLRPTAGSVMVRGRVAPLLELGAGFDMELSGRENVFLNGAILGRHRKQIEERFDAIVRFAELAEFIDAPLRTYSTGMVGRLGFAVATDVDPDILLVDEGLAVGDLAFQAKCFDRMHQFVQRQTTLILVSHSPHAIKALCQRAIWIDAGRIVADGPCAEVVDAFVAQTVPAEPASGAA